MAYEQAKDRFDGIGYVVMEDEGPTGRSNASSADDSDIEIAGIIGISLDRCRSPSTGEVSLWAESLLHRLNSPSCVNLLGTGFIIFCRGVLPDGLKGICIYGIDDLSSEAKDQLGASQVSRAVDAGNAISRLNLVEINQSGPRYFPLTGEWLEGYPAEMEDRTKELKELLSFWTSASPKADPEWVHRDRLPHLDIKKVIDISGFNEIGDGLIGPHPLFPDGTYLKVNPARNLWCFFQEGNLILGDAWLWLAAEGGLVNWKDIALDTLSDATTFQKLKEHAVSKGFFTEDDLFPERKIIRDALHTVADLKDKALLDPGLPFEPKNVEALAIVKIANQAEYERVKGSWKNGNISLRELNKAVEDQVREIRASNMLRSEPVPTKGGTESLPDERKPIPVQIVDTMMEFEKAELWHNAEGSGYISVVYHNGHFEHRALKAKATKQWLGGLFHDRTGKVANSSALSDAINVLEGNAMKGPQYATCVRIAYADNIMYIDLGDTTWDAVKVTADGWDVVKDVPVKFRRGKGLRALPFPEKGGSIDDLRSILSIKDDKIWLLVKGWLIGSLSPAGPYAILAIVGEQGSAKSWLLKILRSTIDPNELLARRPPKSTDDLMINATNNWIVGLDNLSKIAPWLSDDLCNLATGGGLSKRELYADAEETILRVCRPIILNGIEDVVTRQDLLDRAIVAILSRISDDERRPEGELLKEFDRLHPRILGALLDAVVMGMKNKDTIKLDRLPRMADFAKWVAAALGDEGPEFLAAYEENRDNAVKDALEGDPIVVVLKQFLDQKEGKWAGTATELLALLNAASGYVYKPKGWPQAPNTLSGILRRLAPALRKVGIEVEFSRDEARESRIITITREEVAV